MTDLVLHKAILNHKQVADIGTGKVNYDEINKGIFSKIFRNSNEEERDIENYLSSLLSKGFFATRISDVHVSKETSNITIRVEGTFQIPLKGVQRMISGDKNLVVEAKAAYHNPADTVRISEVILDTGSKIKGFDKLKEKIGRLIPD
jgi:hypothetical protein